MTKNTDSLPQLLTISRDGFAEQVEGPFENYAEARARMLALNEQHPADGLSFSTSLAD
jgi:hypothetical protein